MLPPFLSCVFSCIKQSRQSFPVTESGRQFETALLRATFGLCNYSLLVFSDPTTRKLTVSDFLESFFALFISRYLTTNSLVTGPYCTFQAVGLISGVLGSAIWTLVVTVNTFLLLAGGRNTRAWLIEKSNSGWGRWVFCVAIWMFIIFSGLFGFIEPLDPNKGPYCMHSGGSRLTFQMINWGLDGVTSHRITAGKASFSHTVTLLIFEIISCLSSIPVPQHGDSYDPLQHPLLFPSSTNKKPPQIKQNRPTNNR